jgi:drug/metabolite transporter (DMT)-like permease
MTQSKGMLYAFTAFLLWVVVDAFIKLGSQQALSPFMIMAALGSVGAVSIAGSALAAHNSAALRPQNGRSQIILCLCAIGITYVNVIALKHLPLTIFYIVVFMAPLMVAALSAALKHEKLTLTKIFCLAAGFSGVVLAIATRNGLGGGEWLGYLSAFASIVFFAISTVVMRKLPETNTAVISNQFFTSLSVAAVGILGVLQTTAMPSGTALGMIVVAGAINMLGNVLYNKALQKTAATNVAQLHYTQIISGALLSYLIWNEMPTWNLVAGSVVIIASSMVVAARVHKDRPEIPLH